MGAMNDFLTMVHEQFAPASSSVAATGREQSGNQQQSCHHHPARQQQQPPKRRPRRLNCEKANLLSGVGGYANQVGDDGDVEFKGANWDLIPAPPITPPAAFRPNPDSCYRRVAKLRKGKNRVRVRRK